MAALTPRRLSRGLREVERRGFKVRLGDNATVASGHTAGSIQQRIADLHGFFSDDNVRAIVCAIGGYNSHQLLEELDYDLIASHPKVFCGYSDITALLAGIHLRTGLVVFMGPALLTDWAELGGIPKYTLDMWQQLVMHKQAAGLIPESTEWTAEVLRWDQEDDRARVMQPNTGAYTINAGRAEGPIVAGHAGTLLLLAGTRWFPELDGALLCLEFAGEDSEAEYVDRALTHLRHLGAYEQIRGMVVGRVHPHGRLDKKALTEVVVRATRGYNIPVAAGFDFGHTEPRCTLPWGVRARLDAIADPRLLLLEGAVVD